MPTVLIADDEAIILKVLGRFLEKEGRTLLFARTGEEALELARTRGPIDAALLDKNFGQWSGLELGRQLKALDADVEVILVTAYVSLQSAVEAVQLGAYDYVAKPIEDFDALGLKVTNACAKAALARQHRATVKALEESERRYRQLFDASPDAMLVVEAGSGTVRAANEVAQALFGLAAGELAAGTVSDLIGPAAEGTSLATGRRRDGTTFPVEVRTGELELGGRKVATYAVRDVSVRERLAEERSKVETQLRHAQKMEAVSRLAGGIGHDLGNLLSVIMTIADVLAHELPKSEDLKDMVIAADRAGALVRQMMALSRRGPASPQVLSANAVVADTAKMLRRAVGETIKFATELAPDLWQVRIDPGHLGQVLVNLAVNARDAMPDGGSLTVRSYRLALGPDGPGRAGLAPGDYTVLEVADTGTGMTEEVRQCIFEPFFTTKEEGKGTGLGLAVTHGIVSQAGGAIEVESEPGRGSVFRVLLPRATAEKAHHGASAGTSGHASLARCTALVAEDEAALRSAVTRALEGAGMRVLAAASGEEALAVARAHGQPIDVLVADIVMPRMSGSDLARQLVAERPGLKVLLMTGFPGDPRAASAAEAAELLQKPFHGSALVERVRGLVESRT
jgi:signal transduction histidine kinase